MCASIGSERIRWITTDTSLASAFISIALAVLELRVVLLTRLRPTRVPGIGRLMSLGADRRTVVSVRIRQVYRVRARLCTTTSRRARGAEYPRLLVPAAGTDGK